MAEISRPAQPYPALQRRTVGVLSGTQVLSGVGVASGVAAGSLLVAQVSGSEGWAGLAQTSGVLGAAAAAVPLARLSNAHGRRAGLVLGFGAGAAGAAVVVLGAVLAQLPVILVGTFLVGSATAAGLQARYAATDLAAPGRVARALSTVVWATTVGAVVGPNLMAPAAGLAERLGLPRLSGPYLVSGTALALGTLVVATSLRPDPLLVDRELRGVRSAPGHVSLRHGLAVVGRSCEAVLGLTSIVVGHAVMVMVMVMTPVHMHEVAVTLTVIGIVISVHILGMYALAPVVGWAADRVGPRRVVLVGALVLLVATAVAGTAAPHDVPRLGVGLFLLGLGWSCTLIAGSALVTAGVTDLERPGVQGSGDTLMNLAGAVAGAVAGVVVATASYGVLNAVAALTVVPLLVLLLRTRPVRAVEPAGSR